MRKILLWGRAPVPFNRVLIALSLWALSCAATPVVGPTAFAATPDDNAAPTTPALAAPAPDAEDAQAPRILQVNSLSFSPDGKTLVAGINQVQGKFMGGRLMRWWSVATGKLLQTVTGPHNMDRGAMFSPDGRLLVGVGVVALNGHITDSQAALWSATTGKLVRNLTVQSHETVLSLTYAPDGKTVAGGSLIEQEGGTQSQVRVWNAQTGEVLYTVPKLEGCPCGLTYTPDGKAVAAPVAQADGDKVTGSQIRLWDSASGKQLRAIGVPKIAVDELAFTPDGERLAVVGAPVNNQGAANDIKLFEVKTGTQLWNFDEIGFNTLIQSVAFSPDGHWFIAGGFSLTPTVQNKVWVWNTETTKEHPDITLDHVITPTPKDPDLAAVATGLVAALSPDGKTLAVGLGSGEVQLLDLGTGQLVREFPNVMP